MKPCLILLLWFSALVPVLAQRVVLIEYFTQASCTGCAAQDTRLQAIIDSHPDKVVAIHYHTTGGLDPMNAHNPADPAARIGYYGFSSIPKSAVEGRVINGGSPAFWNEDTLLNRAAKPSPFTLRARHRIKSLPGADTLLVTVTLRRTSTQPTTGLLLHTAIVERTVHFSTPPGTNGRQDFDWVLKKMLPTAQGQALPTVSQGDSIRYTYKWPLANVYEVARLQAVVFVQNPSTKAVYQAAASTPASVLSFRLQSGSALSTAVLTQGDSATFSASLSLQNTTPVPFWLKVVPEAGSGSGVSARISDGASSSPDSLLVMASPGTPLPITLTLLNSVAGVRWHGALVAHPAIDSLRYLSARQPYHLLGKAPTLLLNLDEGSAAAVEAALFQREHFTLAPTELDGLELGVLTPAHYRNIVVNTGSQYTLTLSEAQKNALTTHLEAGGRLAVIGQSFGYGTTQPTTGYLAPLLNTYLGAAFSQRGNQFLSVRGEPSDTVFGRFGTQNLIGQPGQNSWPDIYSLQPGNIYAQVAFRYSNQQVAGTYCQSPVWKSVFLGFGIEQMAVAAVRRQLLNRIVDYFDDFQVSVAPALGVSSLVASPNPAHGVITVRGPLRPGQNLSIVDLTGKIRLLQPVRKEESADLDIRSLPSGLYLIRLGDQGRTLGMTRLSIVR